MKRGRQSRNQASTELGEGQDKAISFFTEAGFRPDFILWLVKDSHQTIAFLDPKGMRNFTDTFHNPKVQFYRRIKELQKLLKRDEICLESFLLSQTYKHDLRWPSPTKPGVEAASDEYYNHHVVLAKDNPDTYVRSLIAMVNA